MITQDWLLRQVESLHLMITRLLLHKDKAAYELPADRADYSETDRLYALVRACVKKGDYETALELLDTAEERFSLGFAELALETYATLNTLDDNTLEDGGITRRDIERRIKCLAEERGFTLWKN
ncbi:MAG: DUF6483 family protein [Oscillospiraceae bacterium]|jgi:pentatricopeptide repeat protein|nr:DUF6483 family protein [Oscillospiraceae bacterium]